MRAKKLENRLVEGSRIFSVHRVRSLWYLPSFADRGVALARSFAHGRVPTRASLTMNQLHRKVPSGDVFATRGGVGAYVAGSACRHNGGHFYKRTGVLSSSIPF